MPNERITIYKWASGCLPVWTLSCALLLLVSTNATAGSEYSITSEQLEDFVSADSICFKNGCAGPTSEVLSSPDPCPNGPDRKLSETASLIKYIPANFSSYAEIPVPPMDKVSMVSGQLHETTLHITFEHWSALKKLDVPIFWVINQTNYDYFSGAFGIGGKKSCTKQQYTGFARMGHQELSVPIVMDRSKTVLDIIIEVLKKGQVGEEEVSWTFPARRTDSSVDVDLSEMILATKPPAITNMRVNFYNSVTGWTQTSAVTVDIAPAINLVRQRQEDEKRSIKVRAEMERASAQAREREGQEKRKEKLNSLKNQCADIGYKLGSEANAKCVLELFR